MFDIRRVNTDAGKTDSFLASHYYTAAFMYSWVGWIYIVLLQHPLLPEAPTSSTSHLSTFPGRVSEPEPGWGAPWGC